MSVLSGVVDSLVHTWGILLGVLVSFLALYLCMGDIGMDFEDENFTKKK